MTHFTVSNPPPAQTYSLYQKSKVINLTTVTYTQVPACSYTYSQTFSFPSGLDSQITESTSIIPALEVYSVDRTSFTAGTFTVVMQNNIEFGSNQGQTITTFSSISQVPQVNIQITTTNSCASDNVGGTDAPPTFSQNSISVNDGSTGTVEITYSMDTFETSLSSSFNLLCGPRVFTARNNANNAILGGWAAITPHPSSPNKAILTIDPSQYGQLITTTVTFVVKVAVTLKDYSNRTGVSATLTV